MTKLKEDNRVVILQKVYLNILWAPGVDEHSYFEKEIATPQLIIEIPLKQMNRNK